MRVGLFPVALLLLLTACAGTGEQYTAHLSSLEEHVPGRAVVLFDVDIISPDEDARSKIHPVPKWRNLLADAGQEGELSFWGSGLNGEMLAYSVKPGVHRLFVSSYKGEIFWYGDTDRHLMFAVQPDEVVYVGKIVYTWDIPPGMFSIRVRTEPDDAVAFINENYPELASSLKVRPARYVQASGLVEPFGGFDGEVAASAITGATSPSYFSQ